MLIKDLYKIYCANDTDPVGYCAFTIRVKKWGKGKAISTINQGIGGSRNTTRYKEKYIEMKKLGLFNYSYTRFLNCIHNTTPRRQDLVRLVNDYLIKTF